MRFVCITALIMAGCSGSPTSGADAGGSTATSDAGTPAQAATLHFDCRSHNIGVLAVTSSDLSVACDASALDQNGAPIQDAQIQFLEEAGVVTKTGNGSDESPAFTYFPRRGARPLPWDVQPLPGEPSMQVNGVTRNPRDMLVTLVAFVAGDNPQTGDMFTGDPFVDMNDNQKWDPGEPFFSADGSGTYSTAQTTLLWTQIKVLWTGRISQEHTTAKCTAASPDIARGARGSFKFTLVDDFYNLLAFNSATDQICWKAEPANGIEIENGESPCLSLKQREVGLAVDSRGNFPNVTTPASFEVNSTYVLSARNILPPAAPGDVPYTIGGTLDRSLTLDESGSSSFVINNEKLPTCTGLLK